MRLLAGVGQRNEHQRLALLVHAGAVVVTVRVSIDQAGAGDRAGRPMDRRRRAFVEVVEPFVSSARGSTCWALLMEPASRATGRAWRLAWSSGYRRPISGYALPRRLRQMPCASSVRWLRSS